MALIKALKSWVFHISMTRANDSSKYTAMEEKHTVQSIFFRRLFATLTSQLVYYVCRYPFKVWCTTRMLMTVQTHWNKGIQSFLHSNKKFYHQTRRNKVHQRRRSSKGKDTTCDYIMYISYSVYLTFGAKILGLFGETRKEETIMGTEVEHLGWKRSLNISYEEPGKQ